MDIDDLKGKKIAVWGLGKEGWSAIRTFRRVFPAQEITVLNDSPICPDDRKIIDNLDLVNVFSGKEVSQALSEFDVIIKSPGVSRYRPEIQKAESDGIIFTSTTSLWFSEHAREKTICVTGTKGKSTTSMLITLLLREAGLLAEPGGNIGLPLLDHWENDPGPDVWVIELSSYQTSDFEGEPSIAVLLNLFPEHLDWHGSIETYFRDKLNLFNYLKNGISVINHMDEITSKSDFKWHNPVYFNDPGRIHFSDGYINNRKDRLMDIRDVGLKGEHNLSNICAALTVVNCLDIDIKKCLNVIRNFQGLPHRMNQLGIKGEILFVDDSISTTPQSAMAALKVFKEQPVTILLGGYDRGLDYDFLADYLVKKPVHAVITLPESGHRIADAIRKAANRENINPPKLFEAEELFQAVNIAKSITPKGGVILLSPAAPSYGRFLNYEERGVLFSEAAGFSL